MPNFSEREKQRRYFQKDNLLLPGSHNDKNFKSQTFVYAEEIRDINPSRLLEEMRDIQINQANNNNTEPFFWNRYMSGLTNWQHSLFVIDH